MLLLKVYLQPLPVVKLRRGDVQVFWGLKIIWIHLLVLPAIPTNLFRTVRRRASETSCKPILVSGSLAALVTFRKPTSFEVFFFIQMMLPTMDCILCYPVNISRQSYLNALKYCVVPQHFLQVPLRVGTVSVALLIYSLNELQTMIWTESLSVHRTMINVMSLRMWHVVSVKIKSLVFESMLPITMVVLLLTMKTRSWACSASVWIIGVIDCVYRRIWGIKIIN